MAIALLVFLYGSFIFITNAANESERTRGRQHILWGIVGMVVMVSAYAILTVATGTFGIEVPN